MGFFKWWLAVFVPALAIAVALRFLNAGQPPSLAMRIPLNILIELLMLLISWAFYRYRLVGCVVFINQVLGH